MLNGPEEQSKPKVEFFANQAYVFRSKVSLKHTFYSNRLIGWIFSRKEFLMFKEYARRLTICIIGSGRHVETDNSKTLKLQNAL